jgi:lambda family phage tail tape measure protein
MATIDQYKIKITVDGEEQVVDLNDSLDKLQGTLTKTAAAGVAAFTALAGSAVVMADGLVDLADATGISVGKLYQLSAALEASGGKFDDGGKVLMAFSRTIGDIEKGSETTIDALTKLGLSASELQNLSDQELFNRAVQGLANMEDGFTKTQIAVDLFGKSAATLDFKKLADGLNQSVDPNVEKNLKLAADAVGQIEVAFRNLQLAALQAIAPVLEAISQFEFSAEDAKKAMQVLGAIIAGAFAAATVIQITRVVQAIQALGGAMRAAGTAGAFLAGLSGVGLAAVAAAGVAATAAYVALGKAMGDAADEKERLDGAPTTPGAPATPAGPQRDVGQTPAQKALEAAKATTEELRKQNAAALQYQRTINGTIGMSEEIADIAKIDAQLKQDRAKSEAQYEKQIAALKADTSGKNKGQITELETQKKLADEQLVAMANLNKEAVNRNFAEKQTTIELQKQLGIIGQQTQKTIADEEARLRQGVISGQISEQQMQDQLARFKLVEEGLGKERQLEQRIANEKNNATKKQLNNDLDAVRKSNQEAIKKYDENVSYRENKEQSFASGLTAAMTQLQEQFKPYNMMQKAVLDTWGKISNAVDEFVTTGKFKFGDFARSVIADLAKMIIKAQIFKAIQATLGFFGLSLPGLAEGGPAKAGQPYIVGEKGPELFVPKQAGTVIPNNKLGASTEAMATGRGQVNAPITNNYITNNISALDAKSVAQLFAENRKTLLGVTETARREMAYA